MSPGVRVIDAADLRLRNTLRVSARARYLAEIDNIEALPELLSAARYAGLPLLVLGEGSNLLLTGDFAGLVIQLRHRQITITGERSDGTVEVRAEAGARWDDLVDWTLQHGLAGIENLALIPGLCGAAPIQNIGAYGVELADSVDAVEAFDRHAREPVRLTRSDCRFGYRDSLFKQQPDRYIVTAISLLLRRDTATTIEYAGIRDELDAMAVTLAAPSAVAEAVRRLRRRKLPQPDLLPNAGSFFKNPLVDAAQANALCATFPQIPHWPTNTDRVKLSAAWMIEQSGFKGVRDGDAGIAPGHALVLVNYGQATGNQLLAFAHKVQQAVREKFDVQIEPEPVIVG